MSETPKNPIARITDAVCDVLAEQGVSALSMRNVATKAGASIGLITHHFPNRAAMVKAAVNATWHKEQSVVVWPETADKAAVLRAIKVFLPLDDERRQQLSVWVAFWALTQNDPDLKDIHSDVFLTIRNAHMRWMSDLNLTEDERLRYADRICVACDGLLLYSLLDPDYWSPDRQLATVRSLLDEIFDLHERREQGQA